MVRAPSECWLISRRFVRATTMMANVTTTGWTSEPDGRGTFGILRSCVVTLALCVYTALHINIPPAKSSKASKYVTKAKWVLIGMFAPELVVFVAWCQRQLAAESDPQNRRRNEWTLTHGFYAEMGGFAIDTDDPGENPYILETPRLHLGRKGLLEVARLGLLPDISCEYIKDKSKADSLAKALVVTQAGWLILQCIERAAAKLPLTALELNTLAHAVCALVTYALWWQKPLDIEDPTRVTGELVRPLVAAFWVCDKKENICWPKDAITWERIKADEETKLLPPSERTAHPPLAKGATYPSPALFVDLRTRDVYQVPHRMWAKLQPISEFEFELGYTREPVNLSDQTSGPVAVGVLPPNNKHKVPVIDTISICRWRLLAYCIAELPDFRERFVNRLSDYWPLPQKRNKLSLKFQINSEQEMLRKHVSNCFCLVSKAIPNFSTSFFDDLSTSESVVSFAVFCVCAYGGIHASAWLEYFPTSLEQLLWRISSVFIAALGIISMALMFLSMVIDDHRDPIGLLIDPIDNLDRNYLGNKEIAGSVVLGFIVLVLLFYIFTRSFLVVEAFISLRRLPVAAYDTPSWT
ncbi:hypothetical protein B7463_g8635, partial [Scytalidium lignicola]